MFAVTLCYIVVESGVMILLFGEQIATTFPYSFIFSLLIFGFFFWFLPYLGLLELHNRLMENNKS